jgi:hypothetical protein
MRQRYVALLAASIPLLLAACAIAPETSSSVDPLVGCWYGEDFQPVLQRKVAWFMNRKADGTFTIEFRNVERGLQLSIQTEEGRWTHKDDKYTTVTTSVAGEPVDTADPHFTDTYVITSLTDGVMKYYQPKMNMTFTSKKVSCAQ